MQAKREVASLQKQVEDQNISATASSDALRKAAQLSAECETLQESVAALEDENRRVKGRSRLSAPSSWRQYLQAQLSPVDLGR